MITAPLPSSREFSPDPSKQCDTLEILLCDRCRYPICSRWDVLPAEAALPMWREHVFNYDVDLFSEECEPIQAYSATNESGRRFDLLCLAPHVRVPGLPHSRDAGAPTRAAAPMEAEKLSSSSEQPTAPPQRAHTDSLPTTYFPPFVECKTYDYSTDYSFFSGYAWCPCCCANCGSFLGWGFAAENRLQAACRQSSGEGKSSGSQSGNPQESERKTSAAGLGTNSATGNEQSTESNSTHVVRAAPLDQHGAQLPQGDSHAEDPTQPLRYHEYANSAYKNSGVPPDFIAIIITHCSCDQVYPLTRFLNEIIWRPIRQRRRRQIHKIKYHLRSIVLRMKDAYSAEEMYSYFCSMEQRLYSQVPQVFAPSSAVHDHLEDELTLNVDEDGVPYCMHDLLREAAGASIRHPNSGAEEERINSGNDNSLSAASTPISPRTDVRSFLETFWSMTSESM